MPTQIIQTENVDNGNMLLRVDGEMMLEDALLLEKIALELHSDSGKPVTLDLADLDFLDSESASILKRMSDRDGFAIEGMEIFLQSVVDDVEGR
jgi:anti-anti-sigma regulatory factor